MNKWKKGLALVLAAALMLCLAACGSFETRMARAAAKMSKLDSAHMDMELDMQMRMTLLGESLDMGLRMDSAIDALYKPTRGKAQVNLTLGEDTAELLYFFRQKEGELALYLSDDNGATWTETRTELADSTQTGVDLDQLKLFADCAKDFAKAGEETVNGSAATRYDGVIQGEYIDTALALSGTADSLSDALGVDLGDASFSDLGGIPTSLWIDNRSGMIVRYRMDMTALMQGLMDQLLQQMLTEYGLDGFTVSVALEIDSVLATVTLSNFNGVEEVQMPGT